MRTTLTLDPDVAERAKAGAAKLKRSFKDVVNEALRLGLDALERGPAAKPYRTEPRPMGLRAGFKYDSVADLLAQSESEDFK